MAEYRRTETFRRQTLRISFREFFSVVFILTLFLGNGLVWFSVQSRNPGVYAVVVPVATAILSALAILILRRQFTVGMTPESLRCCDFWGKYSDVRWTTVRSARVWHLLNLPYMRIESTDSKRALWLPLNLDDDGRLPDLLASYVDPNHPIRVALAGHA